MEANPAKELQRETEIMVTKQGEGSIIQQDPCDVMSILWDQITFAEKLDLETEIRATKQEGRSIEELFHVMNRLWYQMEPTALMDSSSYRKFQEENHLVQFLLALRDEFEPFKRSLLSRSLVPSLEEVISALKDEEARLMPSFGYLESKTAVLEDNVIPVSVLSCLSIDTVKDHELSHSASGPTFCNVFAAASPAVVQVSDHFGASGFKYHQNFNIPSLRLERVRERMKALCGLIEFHAPDIICFQEVTLDIYNIFRQSSWWNDYDCSVSLEKAIEGTRLHRHFCMQLSKLRVKSFSMWPFRNSRMGRELCMADIQVYRGKSLIVATCHLESPDIFRQMYSKERVVQAKKTTNCLENFRNVIFCGDMNWNDDRDGHFPLPKGWIDAWQELKPGLNGWTYDTDSNPMISANRSLKLRIDRFLCKLNDFELVKISMIGTDAIPGVSFLKQKRVGGRLQTLKLPVLPGDHFGLLLEIRSN